MELNRIERIIRKNIGKPVKIYWIDPASDWNNFIITRFDEIAFPMKTITLLGFDQDGAKHDGIPFITPIDEIKSIKACTLEGYDAIDILMHKMGYEDI